MDCRRLARGINAPEGIKEVLLHACCAPCSSAIVEWLVNHDIAPTIFYFNPNIYPQEEYIIRKEESKRHADMLGVKWIDGDYDYEQWKRQISGLENEPERGHRCELCFQIRLTEAAKKAKELGLEYFTTTKKRKNWDWSTSRRPWHLQDGRVSTRLIRREWLPRQLFPELSSGHRTGEKEACMNGETSY